MKRELPQIVKDVGFDFRWDERKVWLLDVSVEDILIAELTWHFEMPFWSTPGGFYNLKTLLTTRMTIVPSASEPCKPTPRTQLMLCDGGDAG